MERRHEADPAADRVHAPAQPRDRRVHLEQRVRRERAERDDDLRPDDVDLLEQERLARRDFDGLRIAIARRGKPSPQQQLLFVAVCVLAAALIWAAIR